MAGHAPPLLSDVGLRDVAVSLQVADGFRPTPDSHEIRSMSAVCAGRGYAVRRGAPGEYGDVEQAWGTTNLMIRN